MSDASLGLSGHNFDAFVNSQRSYNDSDWAAKIQEKYWRARQKFLAKIERKEDNCIVLSDSKLDSKLELYHSIDRNCARLTDILESYQNCLYVFANEENALGILLKECGKHDKTKAGKIMSITGKSLTQSSHQRIRLYMPLLRLYQEMDTFHSRAVEDTSTTVDKLESKRSQYRSSLLWMKDISEKLDPDVYKQLDKFRRIQNKVRDDKKAFDSMQMDVVQKIDLLMASRCNLINQTLASYQATMLDTFERNFNNFKSVEEIIKNEDIHEYEFKALKQLNPLKVSDDSPPNEDTCPAPAGQISSDIPVVEEGNMLGDFNGDELISQEEDIGNGAVEKSADTLELLETLFGKSQDASECSGDSKEQQQGQQKSQQTRGPNSYKDDMKALRSDLNANLLDIGDWNEELQVASLLNLSEPSSSNNNNDDTLLNNDANRCGDHGSGDDDNNNNNREQAIAKEIDLLDIGQALMPTTTTSKEDFFA